MRTLFALLVAMPLATVAQVAPPPEPPPPAPPPPAYFPAQPSPPGAYPAQPSPLSLAPRVGGRSPWYIGFGVGSGSGQGKDSVGNYEFSDGMADPVTVFVNFKAGATLTPTLLLGFDLSGLRTAGRYIDPTGPDYAVQVSNYDAMVTWFPVERGPFLRGGLGLTQYILSLSGYQDNSINGSNLTVGGGYAFWLGRTFNLTVNLDYSAQRYEGNNLGLSRSHYTVLWLGFDWY
jgi:hypothetical protein